jgi:cytochrome c-type biogenesis protein CcmH
LVSAAFALWSALAVLIAVCIVVWPLLRPGHSPTAARAQLLRERLDALNSAHACGLVSDAEFAHRREALAAEALALIDAPAGLAARPKSALIASAVLVLILPAATYLVYARIGTPHAIAFDGVVAPVAGGHAGDGASASAPDLAQAAERLKARLEAHPEDGEGWALLARTYRAIENFAAADAAFDQARALLPANAILLTEAAEAKGLASNPRSLVGAPEGLVDEALKLEPENPNALFLKGLARLQDGDAAAAIVQWEKLLPLLEPASEAATAVTMQINGARERLGMPPLDRPMAAVDPQAGEEPSPAAAKPASPVPGIDVAVSIAPALASQIAPNDVLYVFARAESGPPAPLAIQRLPAAALPVSVRLDTTMGMIQGLSLERFEKVIIGARVSKSGNATPQPGDLEGFSAAIAWREAGRVEIVIDRVR